MSNVATVSFKLAADQYAILRAMASGQGKSISEFLRETVVRALELEWQARRLAMLYSEPALTAVLGQPAEGGERDAETR